MPEQAFPVVESRLEDGQALITWEIADGYYLYRSKFKFRSEGGQVSLGTPVLPPGKSKRDEFFGDTSIPRQLDDEPVKLFGSFRLPGIHSHELSYEDLPRVNQHAHPISILRHRPCHAQKRCSPQLLPIAAIGEDAGPFWFHQR